MTISIASAELYYFIRKTAEHELTAAIADEHLRYTLMPGTEKAEEIYRYILLAAAEVNVLFDRFIVLSGNFDTGVTLSAGTVTLPANLTFELTASARRMSKQSNQIVNNCFQFMAHHTLMNYYRTVGREDFAKEHENIANTTAEIIRHIAFTKKPPIL